MGSLGILSWFAGILQPAVAFYGLRLNRLVGLNRIGWWLFGSFCFLALLQVLQPLLGPASAVQGGSFDVVNCLVSVLLLIGMVHIETVFSERSRAEREAQRIRQEVTMQIQLNTVESLQATEELRQELAARDQKELALTESREEYRLLFIENPQPMWVFDLRSFQFLGVNRAALMLFGFTEQEFLALTALQILPPKAGPAFMEDAAKPCSAAKAECLWTMCKRDGRPIEVQVTAADFKYVGRPVRLILGTDVSQRRCQEVKAREAQRMEVIHSLVGGISRHFNRLFTIIDGQAHLLFKEHPNATDTEQIHRISAASNRGAALTRQLLLVGGRQEMESEALDLNALIERMLPMLRRLAGPYIVLQPGYGSNLPLLRGDPHVLEQIIVNLALNARDAMATGGTLTISTAAVGLNAQAQTNPEARTGEFICLTIRDTGCGMAPEVKAHLFEPFFTTRDNDTATGLGLATVYGAVKQHSGWINVTSEIGAGTQFQLFFPAASRSSVQIQSSPSAKETILLVESDDQARGLARSILSRRGYRVIEADCAATVQLLWEVQAANVDLLLIALALPDISGPELAGQLRQSKPDLKVIFTCCSDLSATPVDALLPRSRLLPKPYKETTLIEIIQDSFPTGTAR